MDERASRWDRMMALREALKQAHDADDDARVAAILEEVREMIAGQENGASAPNVPERTATARQPSRQS